MNDILDKLWGQLPAGSLLLPPKELAFKFARMALAQHRPGVTFMQTENGVWRNEFDEWRFYNEEGELCCSFKFNLEAAPPRRFVGVWRGVEINENTPVDVLLDIITEQGKKAPPNTDLV